MRWIPDSRSRSMRISISGLPPTRSSGLGVASVSGRSRLPSPPAMMTAQAGSGGGAMRSSSKSRSTTRRVPSTTGSCRIERPRIRAIAATADTPAAATTGARFIASSTADSSVRPRRRALRRSPSVARPTRRPVASTTRASCLPLFVMHSSVSRRVAPSRTSTSFRLFTRPPASRPAAGPARPRAGPARCARRRGRRRRDWEPHAAAPARRAPAPSRDRRGSRRSRRRRR